jgi:tetratricopeptide (TPR) repeat protein
MSVDQAITMMLEGHAIEAIRLLDSIPLENPDPRWQVTLACAHSMENNRAEAEAILAQSDTSASEGADAIRTTALAYLAMHDGNTEEFKMLMDRAISEDPQFPIPHLSEALYYLWRARDFDRARDLLYETLQISPTSPLVRLHLIGLEASAGNMKEAQRLLGDYRKIDGARRPPLTLGWMLALSRTPLGGGLFVLFLVVLSFLPYVGIAIAAGWVILSVITYRQLLRISPRLAVLPGLYLIAILGALTIKLLITEQLMP